MEGSYAYMCSMVGRDAVRAGLFWCAGRAVAQETFIRILKNQDLLIFRTAGKASLRRFA
jgi:hypothetical protein